MITHNTEVIVYDGVTFFRYPLRPRQIDGRAGRGDTTFSSYLAMRLTMIYRASSGMQQQQFR